MVYAVLEQEGKLVSLYITLLRTSGAKQFGWAITLCALSRRGIVRPPKMLRTLLSWGLIIMMMLLMKLRILLWLLVSLLWLLLMLMMLPQLLLLVSLLWTLLCCVLVLLKWVQFWLLSILVFLARPIKLTLLLLLLLLLVGELAAMPRGHTCCSGPRIHRLLLCTQHGGWGTRSEREE